MVFEYIWVEIAYRIAKAHKKLYDFIMYHVNKMWVYTGKSSLSKNLFLS